MFGKKDAKLNNQDEQIKLCKRAGQLNKAKDEYLFNSKLNLMKLTNFTFLRAGKEWTLKSALLMLVFMILSFGSELQAQSNADLQTSTNGVALVNHAKASQLLGDHMASLQAITPANQVEEANLSLRLEYAKYVLDGVGQDYKYRVESGMGWLETRISAFALPYRSNAQEVYQEMVDLLRS